MQKTKRANGVVRREITRALYELIEEKPLDDISVTEITARAQVARVSFYRNFDSKDDVLRMHARQVTEDWLDEVGHDLWLRDPHLFFVKLFIHMRDHADEVAALMRSRKMDIAREEFNIAFGVGCENRAESARRAFLAGGAYNLFLRWAEVGYDPEPEVLATFVDRLVMPAAEANPEG